MANTNSLLLNGSSQCAYAASSALLAITGDITVEAWLKFDATPSGEDCILNRYFSGTNQRAYLWSISDGIMYFQYDADGSSGSASIIAINTAITSYGVWEHWAVAVDVSAATAVFYKNGVVVASTTTASGSTAIYGGTAELQIGADRTNSRYYFGGSMDEVRIWNDIRTAQEIFANYRKELIGSEAGLVGYWKFNNSTRDSTGFGNTLTLVGSPTYSTPAFTTETAVFYSGAGDGFIRQANLGDTWANTHDAASGDAANTTAADSSAQSAYYSVTGKYYMYRAFLAIDTSAIPSSVTIISASLNLWASSVSDADNDGLDYINIVQGFQDSTSTIVTGDYEDCGSDNGTAARAKYTPIQVACTTGADLSTMSTTAYTVYTFNATGIGFIVKAGTTKLGIREGHDIENTAVSTGSGFLTTGGDFYNSREAGKQPYLEVTYTTSSVTDIFRTGAGDGRIGLDCTGMSWATCRNAATGSLASPTDSPQAMTYAVAPNGYIQRGFFPVDTNSLPSGAVISAATLNIYATDLTDTTLDGYDYGVVVQTTQPDHTTFTTADYDLFGTTKGSADLSYNGIQGTNKWVAFTLNSTGIGWIKKAGAASTCGTALTGWTCLGTRCGNDLDNVEPPASPKLNYLTGNYSESGTNSPYLAITYTTFDLQRQNIINGLTSAQSEATGWNAEVKAKIPVTDVVRTSDTAVTITLSPEAAYNITATETVTSTVPPTALGQTMNTNSLNLVRATQQYAMREAQNCTRLSGFTSMTWEFWVKVDVIGISQNLVNKNYRPAAGSSRSWHWEFDNNNKLGGTVHDDGTANVGHYRQYVANTATATVGVWQHYAISYDGSTQTLVVIKDGSTVLPMTLVDGTGCTSIFDNPTADLLIAGYADDYWVNGLFNEVRIWSDVRTPAEIQANYTKQLLGTEANLEGYWRFNNNGLDLTVNGNDLTLINSPTYSTTVPFTCGTDIVAAPTFDITGGSAGPANVKTFLGLASASTKTLNGLAIASVKTWNGIA